MCGCRRFVEVEGVVLLWVRFLDIVRDLISEVEVIREIKC